MGIQRAGVASLRRILLAAEAVPESRAVIEAGVRLGRRSHSEVLVLSVRERDFTRGFVWDVIPPGEVAELVSRAIYELQRVGVQARGLVRTARTGRVADEIVYTALKHRADVIVVGQSTRSWIGRLLYASVTPSVLRLSPIPVVTVPLKNRTVLGKLAGASR